MVPPYNVFRDLQGSLPTRSTGQQFLCEADGVRMLPVGFRAGVPFLFSSSVRNRFLFGGVGSGAQPMSNSTFAKPIGSECFQKGSGPEPFLFSSSVRNRFLF